jgi:hypothetical protein
VRLDPSRRVGHGSRPDGQHHAESHGRERRVERRARHDRSDMVTRAMDSSRVFVS